ncbi:MAG: hypothetical protein HY598_03645 [Candidatus Omnitrophica bacterium]|nr:hypothetical protein [Candidatus Omnitrophota bacterium]
MAFAERFSSLRLPPAAVPLAILAAAVIAGGGWLVATKQRQITQLTAALGQSRQQIQQLEAEREMLAGQLETQRAELQARDERLASLRAQLASASKDLEQSSQVLQELKQRYDTLAKDQEGLQGQLARVTGERDEVRKRAELLEQGKQELERSVGRLRERLALLDRDYRKLSDQLAQLQAAPLPTLTVVGAAGPTISAEPSVTTTDAAPSIVQAVVELPPIVVRKDQAGMAMPVRARVLEVSAPHNFIVVDKGSVDGVRVGMAFDLVRGANTVGRATVVRVRPQLSACDLVRAKTPGPVQAGDLAVQSGP